MHKLDARRDLALRNMTECVQDVCMTEHALHSHEYSEAAD